MWNDVPDGVLTMMSGSGELSGEGGMCVSCFGEEEIATHPAAWQAAAGNFPRVPGVGIPTAGLPPKSEWICEQTAR